MRRGTYSIVAHDPQTGECGVAVQSHWFSVGSVVTWGRAGVGAVATQSIAEPGVRAAAARGARSRRGAGRGAEPARRRRPLRARFRQVAVRARDGAVAVHTGESLHRLRRACDRRGLQRAGEHDGQPSACGARWRRPTSGRWLAGAPADGGPRRRRGRRRRRPRPPVRGAARRSGAGEEWHRTELRVEDDPEPLEELRRLLGVREAYDLANKADDAMGEGRHAGAARYGAEALALSPDNHEFLFWAGLGMAQAADLDGRAALRAPRDRATARAGASCSDGSSPEIAPSAAAVAAAPLALARGLFLGTARPASDRSSAVWMMRLCSAMWAAG